MSRGWWGMVGILLLLLLLILQIIVDLWNSNGDR